MNGAEGAEKLHVNFCALYVNIILLIIITMAQQVKHEMWCNRIRYQWICSFLLMS